MEPEREEKVYDIFQSISGDYDRMNDVISLGMPRGWKRISRPVATGFIGRSSFQGRKHSFRDSLVDASIIP